MKTLHSGAALGVTLALLLGACSSSSSSSSASAKIDSQGGSLGGTGSTGGFLLQIPAGALAQETTITIDPTSPSPSTNAVGNAALFGPAGLTFSNPVELTLPFDPSRVTNPAALVVFRRDVTGAINQIPIPNGGLGASTAKIQISGFSAYWVGTPGGSGGGADLSTFFPLGEGDTYTFNSTTNNETTTETFSVDTNPQVSRPPVPGGLDVIHYKTSDDVQGFLGEAGALFTRDANGVGLPGFFGFATDQQQQRIEFYGIYDPALPFLPSSVTLDEQLSDTSQLSIFLGTSPFGSSTVSRQITYSLGGERTVPAGTFTDILQVSLRETITDNGSQQVSSDTMTMAVFARGVGEIFSESTDMQTMETTTNELVSATVGGNPIGGGR